MEDGSPYAEEKTSNSSLIREIYLFLYVLGIMLLIVGTLWFLYFYTTPYNISRSSYPERLYPLLFVGVFISILLTSVIINKKIMNSILILLVGSAVYSIYILFSGGGLFALPAFIFFSFAGIFPIIFTKSLLNFYERHVSISEKRKKIFFITLFSIILVLFILSSTCLFFTHTECVDTHARVKIVNNDLSIFNKAKSDQNPILCESIQTESLKNYCRSQTGYNPLIGQGGIQDLFNSSIVNYSIS